MKPSLILLIVLFFAACSQSSQQKDIPAEADLAKQLIDSLKNKSVELYRSEAFPTVYDSIIRKAIAIARNSGHTQELFDLYVLVGRRYRNATQYGKAIDVLQGAMEVANSSENNLWKAKVSHDIAVNLRRINDNAQALKFHIQALELAESVNDTFLIHCSYNGAGNVYFDYKDYPLAISYFHKSLDFIGKNKPNILGEAINANLLGEAWLFLGNTDSALYYLNQSFDANVKLKSNLGKAICYNGMGLVYHEKKDYSKAIQEFTYALQLFEDLEDRFYQGMCLSNMGKTYLAMHAYGRSETHFKKALKIATEIGSKRFALEASLGLGKLYNLINESNLSYQYNLMAMAYKDSITTDLQQQNTEAMNVLYKAEKQEREIVILKQNAELHQLKMNRQLYIFFVITGVVLIFILLVLFTYKQRRLESRLNEIGLEQKLLRAQLNPHFVFNSLGAVQNFILQNEPKAASDYLVNFSRLMRNILLGSGEDFILLENELEMLDDYLKLQQLRFHKKFDYSFELSEGLNPQTTLVPPMLIQPFVENAIEHGLRDIDEHGIIIIRFHKKDVILVIEVEDNGKGLGGELERENPGGHISMATKITRQRMENLQTLTRKSCKFDVFDKASNSEFSGVLVHIEIPFQEEF